MSVTEAIFQAEIGFRSVGAVPDAKGRHQCKLERIGLLFIARPMPDLSKRSLLSLGGDS
jgi:hypothetical protein